jgi:hypothetical protein
MHDALLINDGRFLAIRGVFSPYELLATLVWLLPEIFHKNFQTTCRYQGDRLKPVLFPHRNIISHVPLLKI